MRSVWADVFFEFLYVIIGALLLAWGLSYWVETCDTGAFYWNGTMLTGCVSVASILCAFDGIHREVLMHRDSAFMRCIRRGRYAKSFHYISLTPLLVSLAFIVLTLGIFLFTCTDEGNLVKLAAFPAWLKVWLFFLFAMLGCFLDVHLMCCKIMSSDEV